MYKQIALILILAASQGGAGAGEGPEAQPVNRYASYPPVVRPVEGISWPKGQAIPTFAAPAPGLDVIVVQALTPDEQITFSALQGQVNRKKPRLLLLDARAEEGRETWPNTPTAYLMLGRFYNRDTKYELAAKYAGEVSGVVLYDPSKSPHYRNLACSIAGWRRALPVTREVFDRLKAQGVSLEVVKDLTGLPFTTALEIYQYLHDYHWPQCEKRLIVSAKPLDERGRGDYHHTRDMAAATGAATVWLDTLDPEERDLLRRFFRDMTAGEGIALGWYSTERSGIPTASEFGIGTLPADFFVSSTVYAGTDPVIKIPPVPARPALENKAYVAMFISDGDNIQYTQHAMRGNWDRIASIRGKVALNWTIAPGLVDIAPGILNYYYTTASPADCFVTGPSGMGYLMPYNTLEEPGAPVGDKLPDPVRMDGFARLTETYLQRSGLRVMTIWDDATAMQRQAYETHCRTLYGATVQNFKDVRSVAGGVVNHRIRFDKLGIPYAGSFDDLHRHITRRIRRHDGAGPLFLSYQVEAWGPMRADRILELRDRLASEFPGGIEFVRADHYFNLYNEANGVPANLGMAAATCVTNADGTPAPAAADGTPATVWTAPDPAQPWLEFDFGGERRISRCLIRHAGAAGLDPSWNTRAYRIEIPDAATGGGWKAVHRCAGNRENGTDFDLVPFSAAKIRIVIEDPGEDRMGRFAEVELYGTR